MIGAYGDIIFETSDERVLTFNNFQRDSQGRWSKHDRILQKPASEFEGPDLDVITFVVTLNASLGVNPREEMIKWLKINREGKALPLAIGGSAMGVDKWVTLSVTQMWNVIWDKGEVFSGQVEVTLEEYLEFI